MQRDSNQRFHDKWFPKRIGLSFIIDSITVDTVECIQEDIQTNHHKNKKKNNPI